jgi:tetratricopeptide (TPR) repeat protein
MSSSSKIRNIFLNIKEKIDSLNLFNGFFGNVYLDFGNLEKAIKHLEKATSNNHKNWINYFNLVLNHIRD